MRTMGPAQTGAITLIASDAVWNAIPGNLLNSAQAQVLAGAHAPQYRPRPAYDPPVAIDKAATVAYTLAQNTLSDALLASVGPVNKTTTSVDTFLSQTADGLILRN
jgi:hypothetical protein